MFQMKNYLNSVLFVLLLMTGISAIAAPQSFVGTLSESMCGAKHMMPGKTDEECTRVCVRADSKYALVADKKIYILSGPQDFSKLAGKRVRVTGEHKNDTISVESMVVAPK